MHGVYFAVPGKTHLLRVYGMLLTLIAQGLGVVALAFGLIF